MAKYSLTVKEVKDWVNSIPAVMDMEQVAYINYEGDSSPTLDINIMFKKGLCMAKSQEPPSDETVFYKMQDEAFPKKAYQYTTSFRDM